MAQTGADRETARDIARQMTGADRAKIRLPLSEHPTIRLALAVAGQWRMVPMGLGGARPVAFDMSAVDATARWLGISPSAYVLDGLALIEREALKLMRPR